MEGILDLLVPLMRLFSYSVLVVVFFVFIVRPLLNYIIVNREIEQRKKLNEKMASTVASPGHSTSHGASEENIVLPEDDSTDSATERVPGQQVLNRLASSDADKAVDLVKQWVHGDSPK